MGPSTMLCMVAIAIVSTKITNMASPLNQPPLDQLLEGCGLNTGDGWPHFRGPDQRGSTVVYYKIAN